MDYGFDKGDIEPKETGTPNNEQIEDISGKEKEDNTPSTGKEVQSNLAKDGDGNNNTKDGEPNGNVEENEEVVIPVGTVIELDDEKLTVSDNGDVVNEKGEVVKEAKDVSAWAKELGIEVGDEQEEDGELSINSIKEITGIDITDEEGNPVEFENTPEGVSNYINSIVETNAETIAVNTINSFYQKYPFLENAINYYVSNNNSLDGYNEIKDRSSIQIEDDNEEQHIAIIKEGWKEQNRTGDVDRYIQYLKSQGQLLDTAKEELQGMIDRDVEYKDELAEQAEQTEQDNIKKQQDYWNGVKNTIDNRTIGKYKLPETLVIKRDGVTKSATPDDFFNYIYQVDDEGLSAYERDLQNQNPADVLNNELLDAYIKFSGGDYNSLVNMAINQEKTKRVIIASSKKKQGVVKVFKPKSNKKEVDFGF